MKTLTGKNIVITGCSGGIGSWDLRNNAFWSDVPGVASDPSNKSADAGDFEEAMMILAQRHAIATGTQDRLVPAATRIGLLQPFQHAIGAAAGV